MPNPAPVPWLRTRLSIQMFLQFAIWGAWAPVLGNHLSELGFSLEEIGYVYLTGALATMISPLIAGQIADRHFATERFLGASFIIAGLFFFATAQQTTFAGVWWLAFAGMLFFAPTLGLANALSFHHLRNAERDFPRVRLWGTIGWIAAGWLLSFWLGVTKRPMADALRLGGLFAILNGLYCLSLPHTPPKREAQEKFAVGKVWKMLRDPSFAVFSLSAFLLLTFATFYYNYGGVFFEKGVGLAKQTIPRVMSIGQAMEIITMAALPFFLARLGFQWTIALGIAAWGLRFGIFALGAPAGLMIAAQALHGICFAFAIAAAMIYVDRICAPDAKGSMQSFLAWITYGFGTCCGSLLGAQVSKHWQANWTMLWLVPAVGCGGVLVLFLAGFRARKRASDESHELRATS